MSSSFLNMLVERLPYSDGGARRRFIAGGTLVIGITVLFQDSIGAQFEGLNTKTIISSPVLAAGLLLIIYAIGSIVELFGEFFFIRAASGLFWAIKLPYYRSKKLPQSYIMRIVAYFVVPLSAPWFFIKGLFGVTDYEISLAGRLSPKAKEILENLPERIALGLTKPVGDESELALKYMVEMFEEEQDKKWARLLVRRTKDISATTTSLFLVLLLAVLTGSFGPWQEKIKDPLWQSVSEADSLAQRHHNNLRISFPEYYYDNRNLFDSRDTMPSKYEVEETIRYLASLKSRIKAGEESPPAQIDSLWTSLINLNRAIVKAERESGVQDALRIAQTIGIITSFVFLYIGFFSSLRNAIIAMLEALALRNSPQ